LQIIPAAGCVRWRAIKLEEGVAVPDFWVWHFDCSVKGVIVGAVIAGFVIVSLLLETISSSPKPEEVESSDATVAPQ